MPVFEGKILGQSGKGVTDFTIRELCNMVYYHHVSQIPAPQDEDAPTVEEQIEIFEEKIGQRIASDVKAMKAMRNLMLLQGKDPDAVPELSPELAARLERDKFRMETDDELMWNGTAWEGKEIRGKLIKPSDKDFE